MAIEIKLSDKQARKLEDVLAEYEDCKYEDFKYDNDEGWQSDELIELYELVKSARNESYRREE